MLSPDLQRIEHIKDYCVEIEQTIVRYGNSIDVFSADLDYQKSISFSLLQIGELSGSLSDTFKDKTVSRVPWKSIKGMRNLFAHDYGSMSREIVWKTATEDIPVLLEFCNQVLNENQI